MKNRKLAGFGIAAVAAASFALVSTPAVAHDKNHQSGNVKCYGVNACKGKGKGMSKSADNSCKGQGYVMVSKSACDQLGGTMQAPSSTKSGSGTQMQQQQSQPQTTSLNTNSADQAQ